MCVGSEIGRLPPQFGDAAKIATNILNSGFEYDSGKMLFNRFKSVVSYDTTEMPIYSMATVNNADKLALYDSLDADVLQSYMEYSLASLIYYCLKEGACSEQSSRMTAMDNSSKNAGMFLDCAVKMTQINYVSRNQLHNTSNGCQILYFGLSWPG